MQLRDQLSWHQFYRKKLFTDRRDCFEHIPRWEQVSYFKCI